jgi:hypothetical protein
MLNTLKFMQTLGKAAPFSDLVVAQTSPDPNAQTDDELIECVIRLSHTNLDDH